MKDFVQRYVVDIITIMQVANAWHEKYILALRNLLEELKRSILTNRS